MHMHSFIYLFKIHLCPPRGTEPHVGLPGTVKIYTTVVVFYSCICIVFGIHLRAIDFRFQALVVMGSTPHCGSCRYRRSWIPG